MSENITETVAGIKYTKPKVLLLQHTGLGVPELAARTCYDSFDNSENDCIKNFDFETPLGQNIDLINNIESSELLDSLAWTYFHHSILEHTNLSFLIKGTSRGVLQEHARHRIQAISVRSTRYTMSGIINAFVASQREFNPKDWFINKIIDFDMFVTSQREYNSLEAGGMYDKLFHQKLIVGDEEFTKMAVAKSSLEFLTFGDSDDVFAKLQDGKKKRNVGDNFKHIVSDVWKVDMVVTFNIRSLKNYFELRDSGAAYFQINWLARAMKEVTPNKYLDLMIKPKKVKEDV